MLRGERRQEGKNYDTWCRARSEHAPLVAPENQVRRKVGSALAGEEDALVDVDALACVVIDGEKSCESRTNVATLLPPRQPAFIVPDKLVAQ